jgi:hypothetical protein
MAYLVNYRVHLITGAGLGHFGPPLYGSTNFEDGRSDPATNLLHAGGITREE